MYIILAFHLPCWVSPLPPRQVSVSYSFGNKVQLNEHNSGLPPTASMEMRLCFQVSSETWKEHFTRRSDIADLWKVTV